MLVCTATRCAFACAVTGRRSESHTRNPNYLGELLIYAGFSSLAAEWAWVPACVLAAFLVIIWGPNMRRKDKSLSRYPEFAEYKRRSGLIIPCIC